MEDGDEDMRKVFWVLKLQAKLKTAVNAIIKALALFLRNIVSARGRNCSGISGVYAPWQTYRRVMRTADDLGALVADV